MSPSEFRRHTEWLALGRVRVVPLEELQHVADDEDAVALTFDDGFVNVGEIAVPLLGAAGLAATIFVVSEHVGGSNAWGGREQADIPTLPLMDWDALGAIAGRGISIGAHTRRHPRLPGLSADALDDEIGGSAGTIAERLGVRPTTFAYPYGETNDQSAALVRTTFPVGVTTVLRGVRATDDRALLPRLDMFYFRAPGLLEAWGSPTFHRRLWLRAQARRVRQVVATGRTAL